VDNGRQSRWIEIMSRHEVEFQKAITTAKEALSEVNNLRDRELFKTALSAMSRALAILSIEEDQ